MEDDETAIMEIEKEMADECDSCRVDQEKWGERGPRRGTAGAPRHQTHQNPREDKRTIERDRVGWRAAALLVSSNTCCVFLQLVTDFLMSWLARSVDTS